MNKSVTAYYQTLRIIGVILVAISALHITAMHEITSAMQLNIPPLPGHHARFLYDNLLYIRLHTMSLDQLTKEFDNEEIQKMDAHGNNILHIAILCKNPAYAGWLLNTSKIDQETKKGLVTASNKKGETALHQLPYLFLHAHLLQDEAALSDTQWLLLSLLKNGAQIHASDCYSRTPIMCAEEFKFIGGKYIENLIMVLRDISLIQNNLPQKSPSPLQGDISLSNQEYSQYCY